MEIIDLDSKVQASIYITVLKQLKMNTTFAQINSDNITSTIYSIILGNMEIFFLFATLLSVFSVSAAITDLETRCNSISLPHIFAAGSCYVLQTKLLRYFTAKYSCNDILGYGGHLIHPKSSTDLNRTLGLMEVSLSAKLFGFY